MGMTFPSDFAEVVEIDGLIDKYFPSSVGDAEFRNKLAFGVGGHVIHSLQLQLKGRHYRKGLGLSLKMDFEALWALEVRQIPNIAEVAKGLMDEKVRMFFHVGR